MRIFFSPGIPNNSIAETGSSTPVGDSGAIEVKNLRILYADDYAFARKTNSRFLLEHYGDLGIDVKVEVASDGQEALNKLRAGKFDILISDIQMPVMNGLELAAIIKKEQPLLPVILVTANNITVNELQRQLPSGVDRVLDRMDFVKGIPGAIDTLVIKKD